MPALRHDRVDKVLAADEAGKGDLLLLLGRVAAFARGEILGVLLVELPAGEIVPTL